MIEQSDDRFEMLMKKKRAAEYVFGTAGSINSIDQLVKQTSFAKVVFEIPGLTTVRYSKPLIDKWLKKEDI